MDRRDGAICDLVRGSLSGLSALRPESMSPAAPATQTFGQTLAKWQAKYPKLTSWVEENVEETLTYYRLPLPHHKHMKSTNMLERLNQELKRRTLVVRIFPNAASCLRLVRALAVEIHEGWLEATRYLNMEHLKEHKKEAFRAVAA
jgi:putative transposase